MEGYSLECGGGEEVFAADLVRWQKSSQAVRRGEGRGGEGRGESKKKGESHAGRSAVEDGKGTTE
eukprot:767804-Hanusia_phi.AAC.10